MLKNFSEMTLFSDIAQHIWLCFDNSEALSGLTYQIMIFSGHFDIEQPKLVKEFEIQPNLSKRGGGSFFYICQVSGFWQ